MKRILFVDDEPMVLESFRALLRRERHRWEMQFVHSGAEALAAWDVEPFDVVVSDMRMPGMDGATLLRSLRGRERRPVCLLLTGYSEASALAECEPYCDRVLRKPCSPGELLAVLEEVLAAPCPDGSDAP